jgi:hypothetical protein
VYIMLKMLSVFSSGDSSIMRVVQCSTNFSHVSVGQSASWEILLVKVLKSWIASLKIGLPLIGDCVE